MYRHVYFNCQFDGVLRLHESKDKMHRKTSRRVKHRSVKSTAFCPARMVLKIDLQSNSIEVKYMKSHNLPTNITSTKFQPIPKSVKKDITTKLSIGIPVVEVWRNVRENYGNTDERTSDRHTLTRCHLLKKSVVGDIKRKLTQE